MHNSLNHSFPSEAATFLSQYLVNCILIFDIVSEYMTDELHHPSHQSIDNMSR